MHCLEIPGYESDPRHGQSSLLDPPRDGAFCPSLSPKSWGARWGILGANLCFRMSPATASPVLQACTGQENWSPGTASCCTQSGVSPGQPHWLPHPYPISQPPTSLHCHIGMSPSLASEPLVTTAHSSCSSLRKSREAAWGMSLHTIEAAHI